MKQATLGSADWAQKVKVTRPARFLGRTDAIIPWASLLEVIERHYAKAPRGRPPHPLPRMLRIDFMQKWRDAEIKQTRKGMQWHFGMKAHVGTDCRGLVHSAATGSASEGDVTRIDQILHGQKWEIFGDPACWFEDHRQHRGQAGIA